MTLLTSMDAIFHEKQEGSLCAQHCLNSLLQGPYFTAVELSSLAQKLDEAERQRMAECGEESEEYRKFLAQPSGNMDDSGYFSVQRPAGVELGVSALHEHGQADRQQRSQQDGRLHMQLQRPLWFNLNSLLAKPELISDTYLALFLAQLKNEGYSIFVVLGDLPECTADEILKNNPLRPIPKPLLRTAVSNESDPDIQAALQLSLREESNSYSPENEDQQLQEALRLSLENFNSSPEEDDEEALLKKAINMSLQC
ncbi:hypothetical protein NQ318_005929 [Aromia moschata]|uniref:ubiquitinyl hydrolase 1 n=1 Tax=Aromia moschata TaxID=1265417 RepID=A0AAV8XKQ0_9CUCU|nr:hypothetical protein NQ318_005929 [Aromia moschata]